MEYRSDGLRRTELAVRRVYCRIEKRKQTFFLAILNLNYYYTSQHIKHKRQYYLNIQYTIRN